VIDVLHLLRRSWPMLRRRRACSLLQVTDPFASKLVPECARHARSFKPVVYHGWRDLRLQTYIIVNVDS
jgi:hypothetical protein